MAKVTVKVRAPSTEEAPNKPLHSSDTRKVTLTLISKEDFNIKSIPELRRRKLKRMIKEAMEQGAALPYDLLSQLLCCSKKTIARDIAWITSRDSSIKSRRQVYKKKREPEEDPVQICMEVIENITKGRDLVFSETLKFLCMKFMKIRKRRVVGEIPKLMESVIRSCDERISGGELGKIKWVIRELKSAGIFLSRGGLYRHIEATRLACEKLGIDEYLTEIICEEIEDLADMENFDFKFRFCPLIIIEECKNDGIKVSRKEVLNSLGFPESVYEHLFDEFVKEYLSAHLKRVDSRYIAAARKIDIERPRFSASRLIALEKEILSKKVLVIEIDKVYYALYELAKEELAKLRDLELLKVILIQERSLNEIYEMFFKIKPGKSKSSVRGTINKNVGRVFNRTGEGKYIAINREEGEKILVECARRAVQSQSPKF